MSSNVAKKLLMEESNLWGGLESVLLNSELAAALNVPQASGLLITKASSKGAGSILGLQGGYIPANINGSQILIGGDIILKMAGIEIKDNNSLFSIREHIRTSKKGAPISITVLRHGEVGVAEFLKQ